MRVLITGGRGLVGRNLQAALLGTHEILAPTREELDLLKFDKVVDFLRECLPDMIIHCAGTVGGIQANIREPVRFFLENLDVTKNTVLAAAVVGVPRVLNFGSSCMYPRNAKNPMKETAILQGELEPTNEGYALAKIMGHRLCEYLMREDSSKAYKTVVPCNLYGKWDNFDPGYSHMIPAALRKVHDAKVRGDQQVEIWGTGTARREFMYAGELAEFVAYALENFEKMPSLVNVGIGRDYSVDEYYHMIAEVVGYTGTFVHDTSKPEGMAQKLVDISLLSQFNWKSELSTPEGLRLTYEFFLKMENEQ